MKRFAGWLFVAAVFTALGAFVMWSMRRSPPAQEAEEHATGPATAPSSSPGGRLGVALDRQTQARIDLEVRPVAEISAPLEVVAYGRLEEDPARAFILRAPVAGTLASEAGWPRVGQVVSGGQLIGTIEPRFTPMEQLDLLSRLNAARAQAQEAAASLAAERTSLDQKRLLHDRDRIVSDRSLAESQARVKVEEARLQSAEQMVRLLETSASAVPATAPSLRAVPLTAAQGGEVVEVLARPGEAVDSGQALLRLARFDSLLARVELPVGEKVVDPLGARIVPLNAEDVSLPAVAWSAAPAADARMASQVFLLRVEPGRIPLRPGAPVIAYLHVAGEPDRGIWIPRSAIVRDGGRAWVYVRTAQDTFLRKAVRLGHPLPDGWLVAEGPSPGEALVVRGAQALLSEELKARMEQEEE